MINTAIGAIPQISTKLTFNDILGAGKGTFGTNELLERLARVKLSQVVSHRTIIIPQLGAPGVSAHEVQRHSGFKVVYGPIRAEDIRQFLNSGMKAIPEMRTVKFTLYNRLVLTPMELVGSLKALLIILKNNIPLIVKIFCGGKAWKKIKC